MFINYAHRGASAYYPENTMSAFYAGISQGANGIETDIQRSRDGVLVLFHDETLDRVTGRSGKVSDYTWEELSDMFVKGPDDGLVHKDRIITLDNFLHHFADHSLTFALEMKCRGIASDLFRAVEKFGILDKAIFASFNRDDLTELRKVTPQARVAYLTDRTDGEVLKFLQDVQAYQICLKSSSITPEVVEMMQLEEFSVRAWGVSDEQTMAQVCRCGVDGGMTVNFPDKLHRYLFEHNGEC